MKIDNRKTRIICGSSIPIYITWLKYLSWMMYANEAMTIVQWEGVQNISMASMRWIAHSIRFFGNNSLCQFSACTGMDPRLPCLHDATDIFDQYSFQPNHLDYDLWAMVTLYAAFNVLAFIILWIRMKRYCWFWLCITYLLFIIFSMHSSIWKKKKRKMK